MDKCKFVLILIFCVLSLPAFCATVYLKDGTTVSGSIVEETSQAIKLDTNGITLTYWMDDISRVEQDIGSDGVAALPALAGEVKKPGQIFKEVAPAVVFITNQRIDNTQMFGSGFVIDSQGTIVTNFHVVAGAKDLTVTLKDGQELKPTQVVGFNRLMDICLLRVALPQGVPHVELADDEKVEIGDEVYALGNPLGQRHTISDGIISQLTDRIYRHVIQFTAPVSSGSSGGVLVNDRGQAIGVTTEIMYAYEGLAQNLNHAVGINGVKAVAREGKSMPIDEFYRDSQYDLNFFLATQQADTPELYKQYAEIADKCVGKDDTRCFEIQMEVIRITANICSKFYGAILENPDKGTEDFISMGNWANENIGRVIQAGGIEELIKRYKTHFGPTQTMVNNTVDFTFCPGYLFTAWQDAGGMSFDGFSLEDRNGMREQALEYYAILKRHMTDKTLLTSLVEVELKKQGLIQ